MSTQPYSLEASKSFVANNFAVIVVVALGFVAGFGIGSLTTENRTLLSGNAPAGDGVVAGAAAPAAAPAGPDTATLSNVPEVTSDEHIRGNQNAKITLIEYSDFECPFCKSFFPTTEAILEKFPDDVRLVYRHYPLSFHPNAQPLAEASECVAKYAGEEAFWEFHDLVFSSPTAVTAAEASQKAAEVGADQNQIQDCIDSGEMASIVTDQMNGGSSAGITGTPGTILVTADGEYELISGALPEAQVTAVIEKYL